MTGRKISGKGKYAGDIEGAFYVSTLEFKGGYHAGETGTATKVWPMRDEHAEKKDFKAQAYG